jgi:hypothetical protein
MVLGDRIGELPQAAYERSTKDAAFRTALEKWDNFQSRYSRDLLTKGGITFTRAQELQTTIATALHYGKPVPLIDTLRAGSILNRLRNPEGTVLTLIPGHDSEQLAQAFSTGLLLRSVSEQEGKDVVVRSEGNDIAEIVALGVASVLNTEVCPRDEQDEEKQVRKDLLSGKLAIYVSSKLTVPESFQPFGVILITHNASLAFPNGFYRSSTYSLQPEAK